jgi:hypothetical protein
MDLYEIAYDNIGIYPKVVDGKDRTEWQDGWNAAHEKILNLVIDLEAWSLSIPAEHRELLSKLVKVGTIDVQVEAGVVKMFVGANDFFCWACSDLEECDFSDLKDIDDNYSLWLCRKRNMQPQPAVVKLLKDSWAWSPEFEKLPENLFTAY